MDVVITELKLPKVDGFGVLKEIRKIDPSTPFIAQTANVLNNMKYTCLNAGFNEFISKPINLNDFTSIVNNYIHSSLILEFHENKAFKNSC